MVDNARMESLRHCFRVKISHYLHFDSRSGRDIKKGKGSTQKKITGKGVEILLDGRNWQGIGSFCTQILTLHSHL